MPLDLPQCITRGAIEGERRLEQPREVERLAHPPPRLPRPSERVRPIGCKPRLQSAIADIETDSASLPRSEEHTSELQSLMRISYAVFCLKKKITRTRKKQQQNITIIW